MKKTLSYLVAVFATATLLSSCMSKKNLMYFADLKDSTKWSSAINNVSLPTFEIDDRISVKVITKDAGTSSLLNSGVLFNSGISGSTSSTGVGGTVSSTTQTQDGYSVDQNGDIYLPYIGKVHALGLTKLQLKEEIAKQISRFIKDPIVYVDWLNFKYTIIGEANSGVYNLDSDRLNIIEAIAKSGDFKQYSERSNVMLFREEDGVRKMVRLDFQNSSIFNSPYFYVKQNDIIYVEPKKYADQSGMQSIRNITMLNSLVTLPLTVATSVLFLVDRFKK